jgi:hypothetical protein
MGDKEKLNRQQQWQNTRRAQGLCICCGKEPLLTKNHGKKCAKKIREAARKRTGATTRYRNATSYQSNTTPPIPAKIALP